MIKEVVIIGGGKSIEDCNNLNLNEIFKNTLVIGCNIACRFFTTTCNIFLDANVYYKYGNAIKQSPTVGLWRNLEEFKYPEVYWLPMKSTYSMIDSEGMYTGNLTGIAAISLATYLLKGQGNVYLLGYDWTTNKEERTHFHNVGDNYFEGYGKIEFYKNNPPDKELSPFLKESKINFINVNPNSNINTFPKISYVELATRLNHKFDNILYTQELLKTYVKARLEPIRFHPVPN